MSTRSAQWRDGEGNTVATVWGATACLNPRHPRDLSAATEDRGFEHVMRCRDCDGCRRYENLLLRRRLVEHFKTRRKPLWMIVIEPSSSWRGVSATRASLMRCLPGLMGFFRLSTGRLALLVEGSRPTRSVISSSTVCCVAVRRLKEPSSLRSFRSCASGMLVPRSEWGRQVKRFYHRGLPQLPKETFYLERRGGIRKRHPEALQGHRAWRDGLTLYPSDRARFSEFIELVRRSSRHDSRNSAPNRGARSAPPSRSAVPNSADAAGAPVAPAATALREHRLKFLKSGRDASSGTEIPRWLADWGARMTEIARKRGP